MNPEKSIFWIATGIIFVFAGVMPTLTSQTDLAVEGIHPLGYPAYFGVMLTVSKMLGFLVITIPQIQRAIKEWAYAGLTFDAPEWTPYSQWWCRRYYWYPITIITSSIPI